MAHGLHILGFATETVLGPEEPDEVHASRKQRIGSMLKAGRDRGWVA